jgi:hypothetical protein
MAIAIAIAVVAISVVVANSVTIAVAVAHRHRRQPLPLRLPLTIAAALSACCRQPLLLPLLSLLPSAINFSFTVGHCSCHLRWPSLSPLLSAISKSYCLGAARIVFNQLKQRMLPLFYFVQTVGSALIKAR